MSVITADPGDEFDGYRWISARRACDILGIPARELYRLIDRGTTRIVVDLGGMEFIDSTGLGVFVGALKRSREGGGELELRSLKPAARKIFDITGLSTAFHIRD